MIFPTRSDPTRLDPRGFENLLIRPVGRIMTRDICLIIAEYVGTAVSYRGYLATYFEYSLWQHP